MTLKALINKIASDLFDTGVDIGRQLAEKDEQLAERIREQPDRGAHVTEAQEREIEFEVFESNSRETWEMKAKGGAIVHIFNQEVETGTQS